MLFLANLLCGFYTSSMPFTQRNYLMFFHLWPMILPIHFKLFEDEFILHIYPLEWQLINYFGLWFFWCNGWEILLGLLCDLHLFRLQSLPSFTWRIYLQSLKLLLLIHSIFLFISLDWIEYSGMRFSFLQYIIPWWRLKSTPLLQLKLNILWYIEGDLIPWFETVISLK